jgi:hypothetical protein
MIYQVCLIVSIVLSLASEFIPFTLAVKGVMIVMAMVLLATGIVGWLCAEE